jgi:hypothetical protein
MLNSGKKIRALPDQKKQYSNSCCPKKKFWTNKTHSPPPLASQMAGP